MAYFQSDNLQIAFDDIGPRDARRTVVLIHGFATNRKENWQRLGWTGAFERKSFRCVSFDVRGHGESGQPLDPAAYSGESMVGDVFALMNHLEIKKADLVGYSMGARIALAAALERPERFDHLVLGGVGERLFEPAQGGEKMAEAMEAEDPETIVDPLLRSFRLFADESSAPRRSLAVLSRAHLRLVRDDADDARAAFHNLKLQVLVVAGARDSLAGDPEPLARAFGQGRAVSLPACDHFSAIPHGLFKAAVFDFLDDALE
jgi:pimeloyl-ACP methyl ester carboxylesterase